MKQDSEDWRVNLWHMARPIFRAAVIVPLAVAGYEKYRPVMWGALVLLAWCVYDEIQAWHRVG